MSDGAVERLCGCKSYPNCENSDWQSSDCLWREIYDVVQMVYLDENLSYRDERSAELCGEQASDEEITQSSSEELQIRHSA